MKLAYFDCQFGAGADMLLAAMLHAGLPFAPWVAELKKLALPAGAFEIKVDSVVRGSLACTKVTVLTPDEDKPSLGEIVHAHQRSFSEIAQIIQKSSIDHTAKALSTAIFSRLAAAEAKVHGIDIDEVHFHEVGAIDAIIDIVGFAIGYTMLSLESVYVTPLPLGSGTAQTAHGLLPIPGPAVLELLIQAQAPTSGLKIDYECTTPTATAILTTIADKWASPPNLERIISIGYGAGNINPSDFPNVCRLVIGEAYSSLPSKNGKGLQDRFQCESITVIEANLDDFSPQSLSYVAENILSKGALDVFVTPCVMKKGRSGHLLTVLSAPTEADQLKLFILQETSSFGVRSYETEKVSAQREWLEVGVTNGQKVRLKLAKDLQGNLLHAQPEYEDCVSCAQHTGLTLKEVINTALAQLPNR